MRPAQDQATKLTEKRYKWQSSKIHKNFSKFIQFQSFQFKIELNKTCNCSENYMPLLLVRPNYKTTKHQTKEYGHKSKFQTIYRRQCWIIKTIRHRNTIKNLKLDKNFQLSACALYHFECLPWKWSLCKRQEKESRKLTDLENSQNSYESTFLSSEEVSQNIDSSANIVRTNRNLTSSFNNETKLLVQENENKSSEVQKNFKN